jgi:hypothetical protein
MAEGTVLRYETTAHRFLQQCDRKGVQPAALTGAHVNDFLLIECGRV